MAVSRLIIAVAALAAALGLAIAVWLIVAYSSGGGALVRSSGEAQIGGPFTLTDHHGRRISDADFRGKLMLVYFGYTWCPDVCPSELQVVGAALDLLGEDASEVVPIFITVDPERDGVAEMAQYVPNFHPSMIGLTGTAAEIAAVAKAYRVYYGRVEGEPGEAYLMDHSSLIYLMDRGGHYLRHFNFGATPESIAEAVEAAL